MPAATPASALTPSAVSLQAMMASLQQQQSQMLLMHRQMLGLPPQIAAGQVGDGFGAPLEGLRLPSDVPIEEKQAPGENQDAPSDV